MKSSNIFLRRPVTAIVISLVILLVGTLAILNMPISQYPDITPPTVQITGNFIGADAQKYPNVLLRGITSARHRSANCPTLTLARLD